MNVIMKHLTLILALLITQSVGGMIMQAAPTSVADTLHQYVIDRKVVKNFDGSQLEGKKITSYRVSTVLSDGNIIKVHTIVTEVNVDDYAYVIDGKQVPKSVFEQLDANGIKNITVIKDGSRDDIDVRGYIGWENGVVLVETKKDGSRIFKTQPKKKK